MSEFRVTGPALPLESPPRLMTLDGAERELLEQARIGFRRGLDERRAFRKLEARMNAPLMVGWRWPVALRSLGTIGRFLLASKGAPAGSPQRRPPWQFRRWSAAWSG